MVDWAQILVIILSIFLAIFLLLAIILVVLLIKVTREIRDVTSSAGRTLHTIESAVAGITKVTSPMVLIKIATKYFNKFKK